MGACYGAGLLGLLPPDAVEGENAKLACITEFAESGMSHKFREIIDNRVAEFAYKNGKVSVRWLNDEEAQPVFEAKRRVGGSAPYRLFDAIEFPILCPGFRGGDVRSFSRPGHPLDKYYVSGIRIYIESLTEEIAELENEDGSEAEYKREFYAELVKQLQICRENLLIFTINF